MRKIRGGAVLLLTSLVIPAVSGVAVADTVPQEKVTSEGYHLKLLIDNASIRSVPNMAGAPLVREGFITATSRFEVICPPNRSPQSTKVAKQCSEIPVTATKFSMKAQVGCPMDMSSGTAVGLAPQFTSSIPVAGILGTILPPPTPAPMPSGVTNIGITPTGQLSPQVTVTLFPGYIRDVPLGEITFPNSDLFESQKATVDLAKKARRLDEKFDADPVLRNIAAALPGQQGQTEQPGLRLSVQDFHFEVDDNENELAICGGSVAVRIYATASIQTPTSFDTIDAYGDIFIL